MGRAAAAGLAGLGIAGVGLFLSRRDLVARAIGLRPAEYRVAVERAVPIPMPDGVRLYADRYTPRAPGCFPTILIRTPYGRAPEAGPLGPLIDLLHTLFAERGYNVLHQGVRGRFRSEGHFDPLLQEAADGHATLAWIAGQPWFDGNLGMYGASYSGYTQWAIAADAPEFLRAIVPVCTSARFSHLLYPGGTFALETALRWAQLLALSNAPDGGYDLARLVSRRSRERLAAALAHTPIHEADRVATGVPVPAFRTWLNEGPDGNYWRAVDQQQAAGRVRAAVHLVAGWYDLFLSAQLADYAALLAAGRTPYLTVLPRHHTELPLLFEAIREGIWWLDAHLKGRRELLARRPVRLALMGGREWHEMDFWPPPAAMTRYYLHAEGMLSTHRPGAATNPGSPPLAWGSSSYRFDPQNPTPAIGGPVLGLHGGPRDQRPIEGRQDLLCFTSPPLREALDVIGPVRLELYCRSSAPYSDFVARLCVVEPDGRSLNVCEGLARATPGNGAARADGSQRLEIDMGATARRFRPGQRIRLHICSAAYPRWSPTPSDGRPLAVAGPPGSPVEQTVYHDAERPSALVLPVVSAATRAAMAGERRDVVGGHATLASRE
ncbi:MAG: CocE/NonD family hydrolase [Chloroflexi bacterium OHK40]